MSEMLRPYVRRVMQEKGLTVMGVAEDSDGLMSTELLDDIRQGDVKLLSDSQVTGLAKGLQESEDHVRAVLAESN